MKKQELIHVINQSVVDTNYIKDDKISCYRLKNIIRNWLIFYMISNTILYFLHLIGTFGINEEYWFYPLVRILYISLFGLSLVYFIYMINRTRISVKEKDFLKLYVLVPVLLAFTKIIFPISYYLNTDILLGLINTVSLDLITLIISSLLFKFYFKDNHLNIFILFNIILYIFNILVIFLFSSLNDSSQLLIDIYNLIIFLKDYGLFVLMHFGYMLVYMKKVIKNEKVYI